MILMGPCFKQIFDLHVYIHDFRGVNAVHIE